MLWIWKFLKVLVALGALGMCGDHGLPRTDVLGKLLRGSYTGDSICSASRASWIWVPSSNIHIYIYIYGYIYIYVCACTSMYLDIYIYIYIRNYLKLPKRPHIHSE